MIRYDQFRTNLNSEQKALLAKRNQSLYPLGMAGAFSFAMVFSIVWLPITIFTFALVVLTSIPIRYTLPGLDVAICVVGLFILLVYPALSMGTLAFSVLTAKLHYFNETRLPSVVYWSWWPFWKGTMCWMAMLFGCLLGNHLWYNQIYPHTRIERLQSYQEIDPSRVGGVRLEDAGIVTFDAKAQVDRLSIGCLKDKATYCVAPILLNNHFLQETNYQQYDLFMAGTDCCACPGEFRCGDWNKPTAVGGMRIVDSDARDFYKLAVEDWAATHGKKTAHPIFFQWVQDPVASDLEREARGWRLFVLALLAAPSVLSVMALLLHGVFGLLCDHGYANKEPLKLPPGGLAETLCVNFVPDMHKRSTSSQAQLGTPLATDPKNVVL